MIDDVARILTERAALDVRHLGGQAFAQVVQQRVGRLGLAPEEYLRRLQTDPSEVEFLAGQVAVPETWLFRYPHSFEFLVEALRAPRGSGPIRLLSAGCAAGQEAYSMAAAALHAGCDPHTTRILAIDRRQDLLDAARRCELPEAPRRHPIPVWAARWFDRSGPTCRVHPTLVAMVEFRVGDLLSTPLEPGAHAAIFCRNVLIYLGDEPRRRLLARLIEALAPAGLLFLGHADRSMDAPLPLERVGGVQTFAFRRATEAAPVASSAPLPPIGQGVRPSPSASSTSAPPARAGHATPAPVASSRPPADAPSAPDLESAQRLADEGRLAEAAATVRAIVARFGASAGTAEVLGLIALAEQDLPTARRHLEESVYLEPRRASALLNLALVLERLGEGSRASSIRARARRASAAVT